jgi:DNA-binding IclR family transcriptional regulator
MLHEPVRQNAPQSVTRVIRILEVLCASSDPVSLADLARVLATPKSSLAALLRGLAEEDFVVASDSAWRLGPGAYGLGSALLEARRRLSTPDLLRDGMRRLVAASGETVLFAVPDADLLGMTYVDVIESRNAVRFAVAAGDRRPLYATAGGRMLLAARPEQDVAVYLAQLRPERLTPSADISKSALALAIAEARNTGVAQTVDQAADGVTGTAALIHDASGQASGALVIAAPSVRSQDRLAELRRLVQSEASLISRSLGWREKAPDQALSPSA